MYKILIALIFSGGIALRIYFIQLNEILKIPDSFAYLQMAGYFKDLSLSGFGTGWFGFLYSLPIAIFDIVIDDLYLSAQILNIILSVITGVILYIIGKKYLTDKYNLLFIAIYFLSPTIIHYNINVLSENVYILLFVTLVYIINRFLEIIGTKNEVFSLGGEFYKVSNSKEIYTYTVLLSFIVALMYITRGEAFIYIVSIIIIILFSYFTKKITFKRLIKIKSIFLISFFILIFPYIYYLHSFTGEWGLTNKGSSNLRQAEMRSRNHMDDIGFEKAIGELTPDKHHLIHGFAGGLKYDKPFYDISIKEYILNDFDKFILNFKENQIKLYTRTLPGLITKDALSLYNDVNSMVYDNKIILLIILFPLFLFGYGSYILFFTKIARLTGKKELILILSSFFFIASLFFTLFFVLDRYFIIFLPFSLLIIVYGGQELFKGVKFLVTFKYIFILSLLLFSIGLGTIGYYQKTVYSDIKYGLKKEAGEWINNNYESKSMQIAERFPIVTYYSGTKERWIPPYTDNLNDLLEYLKFNGIDILVVDSSDFRKYRPILYDKLKDYKKSYKGLSFIKIFEIPGEHIILYKIIGADLKRKIPEDLIKQVIK